MNLRTATKLIIIAIVYIFTVRIPATFFPTLFQNLFIAQISSTLSFLASIIFFLFFYFLLKEQQKFGEIKSIILGMTISSALVIIVRFHALLLVNDGLVDPAFIIFLNRLKLLMHFFTWLNSLIIVLFFYFFYDLMKKEGNKKLGAAAAFVMITSALYLFISTIVFARIFYVSKNLYVFGFSAFASILFFLIMTVGFIGLVYFFLTFYRENFGIEN